MEAAGLSSSGHGGTLPHPATGRRPRALAAASPPGCPPPRGLERPLLALLRPRPAEPLDPRVRGPPRGPPPRLGRGPRPRRRVAEPLARAPRPRGPAPRRPPPAPRGPRRARPLGGRGRERPRDPPASRGPRLRPLVERGPGPHARRRIRRVRPHRGWDDPPRRARPGSTPEGWRRPRAVGVRRGSAGGPLSGPRRPRCRRAGARAPP